MSESAAIRDAIAAFKSMRQRVEFTVKFTADLDMCPGWGDNPQDWIKLATGNILNQTHYNTTAEVLDVQVVPRSEV